MRRGSFFVLGTRPDPLAMYLSHCGTLFGTRIQPVEDQSFYDPLRIGQMLSAVTALKIFSAYREVEKGGC